MIQDLGKRMEAKIEKMQEMFNKGLEELKNKQNPKLVEGKKSQRPEQKTLEASAEERREEAWSLG